MKRRVEFNLKIVVDDYGCIPSMLQDVRIMVEREAEGGHLDMKDGDRAEWVTYEVQEDSGGLG